MTSRNIRLRHKNILTLAFSQNIKQKPDVALCFLVSVTTVKGLLSAAFVVGGVQ